MLPGCVVPRAVVSNISGNKRSLLLREVIKIDLSYLTNHRDDELLSSWGRVSSMIENSFYTELLF